MQSRVETINEKTHVEIDEGVVVITKAGGPTGERFVLLTKAEFIKIAKAVDWF